MSDLFKAINHCHALNVMHRDIKPDNIMITSANTIRLIDFGLAVDARRKQHLVAGTPYYMAPEVIMGNYGP